MKSPTSAHRRIAGAVARGAAAGLLLVVVFFAGFIIRGQLTTSAQNSPEPDVRFPLLAEAHRLLSEHYLSDLPEAAEMQRAAIRGYLASLDDPYTMLADPIVAQSEAQGLSGQFGGIGVELKLDQQNRFTLCPYPDSPAQQAGILNGDILIAINGEPVESGTRIDQVNQQLRGEVIDNNGVTITVQSPDDPAQREYFVPFAVVQIPSVVWRVTNEDARIGYIQITWFTSRTPDELSRALEELNAAGVAGYILDLRNNDGGLLQESAEVASEFLDGGVVAYEQSRSGETSLEAAPGGSGLGKPLIVLVNGRTASAAELVAGAIQDRNRGLVIGQQTYGKGSVQFIFRLSDGSALHLTASKWLTPNHTPLDGVGLMPDIPMIPADNGWDVTYEEAVRQLQQMLSPAPVQPDPQ